LAYNAFFDREKDFFPEPWQEQNEMIYRPQGVDRSESRVRRVARDRAILRYLDVRRLGITCARMADELNISPSGVSRSIECGHKIVQERDIEEGILKSQ
jgi:hypothetical protein